MLLAAPAKRSAAYPEPRVARSAEVARRAQAVRVARWAQAGSAPLPGSPQARVARSNLPARLDSMTR
jgi:hypothetical protein